MGKTRKTSPQRQRSNRKPPKPTKHSRAQRPSLVEHLMSGPKLDDETIDLINDRSKDIGGDVDL